MRRDLRLQPLSKDHHHALVLARRATAAASAPPDVQAATWREVVRRFESELAPHFRIEERHLLPALERAGCGALVARTRAEHAKLRHIVSDDGPGLGQRLARFGALLHDHVRFEERELFEVAQQHLHASALDAVARACRECAAPSKAPSS